MEIKVIFGAEKNYCSRIAYAFSQADQKGMNIVFCSSKQEVLDNLSGSAAAVIKETIDITREEIENSAGKEIPVLKLVPSRDVKENEICMFQGAASMLQEIYGKIGAEAEQPENPQQEAEYPEGLQQEPFIEELNGEAAVQETVSGGLKDDILSLRVDLFEQLYASDLKNLPEIPAPQTENVIPVQMPETKPVVHLKKESAEVIQEETPEIEETYEVIDPAMVMLFACAKGGSGNSVGASAAAKYMAANGEKILFLDLSVPGEAEGFEPQTLQKTVDGIDYFTCGDVMIAKLQGDKLRNRLEERGVGRVLKELADEAGCTKVICDVICTYDAFSEELFANAGMIVYTCDGTLSGISKHASLEQTVENWETARGASAQKWFFYNRFTMVGNRIESEIPYIGGIMLEDEDEGIAAFSDQYAKKSFWKKLM